ncbi:MAG: 6-phosphogluconolactonase [Candidatus Sumerlaeia bacterium]|nr:6-phosphogluconolactonase [Candidatus Sumerlaeia bacterium]
MEIRIEETPTELAIAGARLLLEEASRAMATHQDHYNVALSGGSTPKTLYRVLAEGYDTNQLILRRMRYFFGDERSVPNDHADSNVRLAKEGFLDALDVPISHVHTVNGGAKNLDAEAALYEEDIRTYVPASNGSSLPAFDLVFLGMGEDGHTASLFPGTKALEVTDRLFVANKVPQLKTERLTLTYPALNAARMRVVLCGGKGKAPVLKEIFTRIINNEAPVYPIEKLERTNLVWILDREAASQVPDEILNKFAPITQPPPSNWEKAALSVS